MALQLFHVDAFTDKLFSGNPAAVFILPEPRSPSWMQMAAREMNLSESSFLLKAKDGFHLQWFTPLIEVDLCGHGTLASAHVLYETGILKPHEKAQFFTLSGLLTASIKGGYIDLKGTPSSASASHTVLSSTGRKGGYIELDFPAIAETAVPVPPDMEKAIGASPKYVGKAGENLLVEIDSDETLRGLRPSMAFFRTLPEKGVIITSLSSKPEYDFVSRFFAPRLGIPEDPVTGSAHAVLGPYWYKKLGKPVFKAYQASPRGGFLNVSLIQDRVLLSGKAVTVYRGEWLE